MRVGVIGAMASEVAHLKGELTGMDATRVAGMDFAAGKLGEVEAVVVQCGIGKVNAGICVQVLADRFGVTHVINTGVAGSLDDSLDIGDLVVSEACMQHDFDLTPLGYKPGVIPGPDRAEFVADAGLREAALEAAAEVAPQIKAVPGRVVSGDQFITSEESKARLTDVFHGTCCEMEGAAIAQAATLNDLPFVVVRAISDKPGHEDQTITYEAFEAQAAENCARIVARMVAGLAA